MTLWRVSNHSDLTGLGGERADGRWHSAARGKRIVYLSEHPALALLEVIANLKHDLGLLPDSYRMMKTTVAQDISPLQFSVPSLPENWIERRADTQLAGDTWLAEGRSALLAVPSVICAESWNFLLNPLHEDAKQVTIDWHRKFSYDPRLLHL